MSNLYELTTDLKNVENLITQDAAEGQNPDECLAQALDELKGEISVKVTNIGAWCKNLDSEAEAIKAEEAKLAARRKSKEALQDRLKAWVLLNIQNGAKFEDSRCQVSTRKSQRVEIVDQAQIPKEYLKTVVTTVAVKEDIKAAIKAGKEVPGAKIVDNISLTIK
jgi:hypothetical protein